MAKKKPEDAPTTDGAPYEANWQIDPTQVTETLLDHHQRTAASPAAHEAYKAKLLEKVEREGVIHVDPATGYRARFKAESK